jgi:hypothetical protein
VHIFICPLHHRQFPYLEKNEWVAGTRGNPLHNSQFFLAPNVLDYKKKSSATFVFGERLLFQQISIATKRRAFDFPAEGQLIDDESH